VATVTDPENNLTTYHYFKNGWLTDITRPDGLDLGFGYDMDGRLFAYLDAIGNSRKLPARAAGIVGVHPHRLRHSPRRHQAYDASSPLVLLAAICACHCRKLFAEPATARGCQRSAIRLGHEDHKLGGKLGRRKSEELERLRRAPRRQGRAQRHHRRPRNESRARGMLVSVPPPRPGWQVDCRRGITPE
jgi:YD repeat-containing protein